MAECLPVIRAPDLKSGSRGFKSCSDHWSCFLVYHRSTVYFVNSQLVCLPPVGIFYVSLKHLLHACELACMVWLSALITLNNNN